MCRQFRGINQASAQWRRQAAAGPQKGLDSIMARQGTCQCAKSSFRQGPPCAIRHRGSPTLDFRAADEALNYYESTPRPESKWRQGEFPRLPIISRRTSPPCYPIPVFSTPDTQSLLSLVSSTPRTYHTHCVACLSFSLGHFHTSLS